MSENDRPRIYLAGPEVFLPDPHPVARAKKAVCAAHGLIGVFPLDAELTLEGLSPAEQALRISAANEDLIQRSDAVIANLTPFRGPSADAGTIYEVGFARGSGKPVFGYTHCCEDLAQRTRAAGQLSESARVDTNGMAIESFGMHDNLMIDGGIRAGGGTITARPAADEVLYSALEAFEVCVAEAAACLRSSA